jgi:hypothetical protein
MSDTTKKYFTYDLGCAAALVTVGFELKSLDRSNRKIGFEFSDNSNLQKAINDYWSNHLNTDANLMLKNRIYNP